MRYILIHEDESLNCLNCQRQIIGGTTEDKAHLSLARTDEAGNEEYEVFCSGCYLND